MQIKEPVVLLTGASSGIGMAIAQMLKDRGFHVYGTSRKANGGPLEPGYEGGFLKMLRMDVLDEDSIREGIEAVLSTEGRIDLLINCAGSGIAGSVEDTSDAEFALQMDTNFTGAFHMIRRVLPVMREQKCGRIINVSSVGGFISIPFQGFYSASKFALESLTETVRMEGEPFGITACMVEPGDTRTGFTDSRVYCKNAGVNPAYQEYMARALYSMERSERGGRPPESVAKVVYKLIRKKRPPVRITVGLEYKLVRFAKRILPDKLAIRLISTMYLKAKKPPEGWLEEKYAASRKN